VTPVSSQAPIVGVIGLGQMGSSFAHDLARGGYSVVGFDTDEARVRPPIVRADSVVALAEHADVILIAVSTGSALSSVMHELLPALTATHAVIDTCTTLPSADVEYAEAMRPSGASFVDAPLTLRDGRTFLVGGELMPVAREILEALGRVVEVGPVGAGQRTKLVNQLLVFGNVALQAEAVALAQHVGVDVDVLVNALHWPISDRLRGAEVSGPDQMPLIRKDCMYIVELAEERGARVPIASLLAEIYADTDPGPLHTVAAYWLTPDPGLSPKDR
jgi:3-hydroxyisobutyrate dehydrogenase